MDLAVENTSAEGHFSFLSAAIITALTAVRSAMRAKETYVIARFDEVDLDCQLSTAFDAGATAGVDAFS